MDPKENFFRRVSEGLYRNQALRDATSEEPLIVSVQKNKAGKPHRVVPLDEVADAFEATKRNDRIASIVIDRLDARPPSKLAIVAIVADLLATIVLAALMIAILLRGG